MSNLRTAATRTFVIHGVTTRVTADDEGLLAAVNRRLRRFTGAIDGGAEIEIHFPRSDTAAAELPPPGDDARVVYDPPVGAVFYTEAADRLQVEYGARVCARCDARGGRATIVVAGDDRRDAWVATHPILTLCLLEMLRRRGRYGLHAAALSLDGHGIVLPGNSGSGKSTLTLALLRAGFALLADDTCFLAGKHDARVLAFHDEIGVTDRTIRFFPELAPLLERDRALGAPKRQLFPEDVYCASLASETRPRAIVFPFVSGERSTRIEPLSPGDALLALVPNVLLTDPVAAQGHLDALSALVAAAPCYRMSTGLDLDAVPALLGTLLGSPSTTSRTRLATA